MRPFEPLFRNPHLATIAGNFWSRNYPPDAFPVTPRLFQTESDVQVRAEIQEPRRTPLGEIIILHGLEGSSKSGYVVSMAHAAVAAGYRATRLNTRSCGGTENLCKTLYHAGLTTDLAAVIHQYASESRGPIYLVGFSLGGNAVLKYAGERGSAIPRAVAAVAAISTPIDLDACCRQMMRPSNRLYESRFVSRLKTRYKFRCLQYPHLFEARNIDKVKSVYEFDDKFTAPHFDFGNAANYYATQSSQNFLAGIRVPALVIQAKDDPLIPYRVYSHPGFANPHVYHIATEHGGHVGFLSRRAPRFWADGVVLEFIENERNKRLT